jgi:hypothetical protein
LKAIVFLIACRFCFLTVLAFNKFDWSINSPIPHIGLIIMVTYGLAQFLLVKGFQMYFTTASKEAA